MKVSELILLTIGIYSLRSSSVEPDYKLYFCLLLYHKTGNKGMEIFQKNVDFSKIDQTDTSLIKKMSQKFIISAIQNCLAQKQLQNEKQLFNNINNLVNNENIPVLIEKYLPFDKDYSQIVFEPLNELEKELTKKIDVVKNLSKDKLAEDFQKYFKNNSHFLALGDRINLFLYEYPFLWGVLLIIILALFFGVFSKINRKYLQFEGFY